MVDVAAEDDLTLYTVSFRCIHSLLRNTAVCLMYQLLMYHNSTQCTAPQVKINLTLLQYHTAVVGAETVIQALHLTAMQLHWTMNAPLDCNCNKLECCTLVTQDTL